MSKIIYRTMGKKSGFIALLSLTMLIIFAIIGVSYWAASRYSTDMIFNEAQRIKARNFAQAGVEKVKINIFNQYSQGNYNLEFSGGIFSTKAGSEYQKKFGDGSYEVLSVKPFTRNKIKYNKQPHVVRGVQIGKYDVWDIHVRGTAEPTGIKAEIRALIKVYRDDMVY